LEVVAVASVLVLDLDHQDGSSVLNLKRPYDDPQSGLLGCFDEGGQIVPSGQIPTSGFRFEDVPEDVRMEMLSL
jgi:hypothetical protein